MQIPLTMTTIWRKAHGKLNRLHEKGVLGLVFHSSKNDNFFAATAPLKPFIGTGLEATWSILGYMMAKKSISLPS